MKKLIILSLCLIGCTHSVKTDAAFQEVSVQQATVLIANTPGLIVLDIRTPREFGQGHIAAAVNADFQHPSFRQTLQQLDKDRPYLLHCASGGRSSMALGLFDELGFRQVYHLKAGMTGWQGAGQPVVR